MFEHAISSTPASPSPTPGIANACGVVYEWHERTSAGSTRGRASCERALALDPRLPEALVAARRILYAQKRYDEAVRDVRRAIEMKRDCDGAYNILARSLFESDRWAEAIRLGDAGDRSQRRRLQRLRGLHQRVRGPRAPRTRDQLRQREIAALEQHAPDVPEDVRARILLAADYAVTGRVADAERELQKAVDLRPNDSNILYNAACTYGVMGEEARGHRRAPEGQGGRLPQPRVDAPRPRPRLPARRAGVREAVSRPVEGGA